MTNALKKRIAEKFGSVRAHGLLYLIGLALLFLLIITGQKACDRYREQSENEKIHALESEVKERTKVFEKYIETANRNHEATTSILDSMAIMSKNIQTLSENDIEISLRVDGIAGEYKATRTATPETRARTVKMRAKIPIGNREIDALKVDSELYPKK